MAYISLPRRTPVQSKLWQGLLFLLLLASTPAAALPVGMFQSRAPSQSDGDETRVKLDIKKKKNSHDG